MNDEKPVDVPSKKTCSKTCAIIGWVLTVLPVAALIMSGVMKLQQSEDFVKAFEHLGWPLSVAKGLGIVELVCAALYFIPQTAMLGAILVTGYLGGAVATHVRIEEFHDIAPPIILGVLAWLGLYFRDGRIRSLVPFRKGECKSC
jgi:xanthine/uracil permease